MGDASAPCDELSRAWIHFGAAISSPLSNTGLETVKIFDIPGGSSEVNLRSDLSPGTLSYLSIATIRSA